MEAYEQLDPEGGFADLSTLMETQVTGKYKERRALDRLTVLVREMRAELGGFLVAGGGGALGYGDSRLLHPSSHPLLG